MGASLLHSQKCPPQTLRGDILPPQTLRLGRGLFQGVVFWLPLDSKLSFAFISHKYWKQNWSHHGKKKARFLFGQRESHYLSVQEPTLSFRLSAPLPSSGRQLVSVTSPGRDGLAFPHCSEWFSLNSLLMTHFLVLRVSPPGCPLTTEAGFLSFHLMLHNCQVATNMLQIYIPPVA